MWIIEQKNSYRVGFTVIIVVVDKRLTNPVFLWTNIFFIVDNLMSANFQETYPLMIFSLSTLWIRHIGKEQLTYSLVYFQVVQHQFMVCCFNDLP